MAAPTISILIDLKDLQGAEIGTSAIPAYVRVALCNYGPYIPRVSGTTMIAKVGPYKIPYTGAPITVSLWGNDVITPVGTFYEIAILDAQNNVLQSNAYVFTGTMTGVDLSTLSPTFPSFTSVVIGGEVSVPFVAAPTFVCPLVSGPVVFNIILTGNVTSSIVQSPQAGQIVIFKIQQDVTGGRSFVWPTNVVNPGVIDPAANSKTVQAFYADTDGNLYPLGPQTWN